MAFRAIMLVLVLAPLTANAGEATSVSVPAEILLPTLGQPLYVGDHLACTSEHDGVYRYALDRRLFVCQNGAWHPIDVTSAPK